VKSLSIAAGVLGLLGACASSRPDHFYILSVQPPGKTEARAAGAAQAILKVTLPSLVDRSEIVINTSAEGVAVLEHERWAAPPADLIEQTLAEDIERRRADLVIGGRSSFRPGATAIRVAVDIVQVTVRRGDRLSIEAHWRIADASSKTDASGGDVFSVPLAALDYSGVPQSLSGCIALLADRLAGQIPAHSDSSQ
jgi:uncharacterized lipoprotein YmbA